MTIETINPVVIRSSDDTVTESLDAQIDDLDTRLTYVEGQAGVNVPFDVKVITGTEFPSASNRFEYALQASDLEVGTGTAFVFNTQSAGNTYTIAIPAEADVPRIADVAEIHLYSGDAGTIEFSDSTQGVTKVGFENPTSLEVGGVLIARRLEADTWFISVEAEEESTSSGGGIQVNNNISINTSDPALFKYLVESGDIDSGASTIHLAPAGSLGVGNKLALVVPREADLAGIANVSTIVLSNPIGAGTITTSTTMSGVTGAYIYPSTIEVEGGGAIVLRKWGTNQWGVSAEVPEVVTGGSIALEQEGIEVVAEASKLNFRNGLFVDSAGNVSAQQPNALDWSVDISDAGSTPAVTTPTLNGLSWSGSAGAGFSSVPAAALATAIPVGAYFELTVPAEAGDVLAIQLVEAEGDSNILFSPPADGHLTFTKQPSGNLVSTPTDGGFGIDIAVNSAAYTLGIETSSAGVFCHIGSTRTQVRAAMGTTTLQTVVADISSASRTITINPSPTVPSTVESGVVALGSMTNLQHPSGAFSAVLPEAATDVEATNGTESATRLFSPLQIHDAVNAKRPSGTVAQVLDSDNTRVRGWEGEILNDAIRQLGGFKAQGVVDTTGATLDFPATQDYFTASFTHDGNAGRVRLTFAGDWVGADEDKYVVMARNHDNTKEILITKAYNYVQFETRNAGNTAGENGNFEFVMWKS